MSVSLFMILIKPISLRSATFGSFLARRWSATVVAVAERMGAERLDGLFLIYLSKKAPGVLAGET